MSRKQREWNLEIDFLGLAIVIFIIGSAIAIGISSYQNGEKGKLEIQLKIEQEKTKQLQYERADTTSRSN